MRKIVAVVLFTLALAVVVPASASQRTGTHAPRVARQGLGALAVGDAFTANDNFFSQTLNHLANPALGSVIAEQWLEIGFDANGVAQNIQGFTRGILLPKALRVSVRVELWGVDSSSQETLLTNSSTLNSAGKLTVQVATPEIGLATDSHCGFFTVIHVGIRWSDQRLTTVTIEEPVILGTPRTPDPCAAP